MAWEIWGIDVVAGEAILRDREHWFLISSENAWRPTRLGGSEEALGWALAHRLIPVGRHSPTLEAAVIETRKVCLRAAETRSVSPGEVLALFEEVEREEEVSRARQRRAGFRQPDWERRLPEIQQAALELDAYFSQKGCEAEEALLLTLEALERYQERLSWRTSRDPFPKLFEIARELLSSRGDRDRETGSVASEAGMSAYEEHRLAKKVAGLPHEVLQCLSLWAGSDYEADDLSILLRIPEDLVRERLSHAVSALGRSLEQLRAPEVARSALRRLGTHPSI